MIEIEENEFARIELDRDAHIVLLVRKPLPFTPDVIERAIGDLQLSIPLRERPRLVILQDLRESPMVRDEAAEKALMAAIPRFFAKFAARAILMKTPVGRLQATRFASSAPVGLGELKVFLDEKEAWAWTRAEAAKLKNAAR